MAANITVTGLNELRRDLRRVRDTEINAELTAVHKELARQVVALALPHVPVKSGKLKASIRAAGTKSDAIGRAGGARVPYAAAIHWGRKKGGRITARPFLWDAAQRVERTAVDQYQEAINRAIAKIRGR